MRLKSKEIANKGNLPWEVPLEKRNTDIFFSLMVKFVTGVAVVDVEKRLAPSKHYVSEEKEEQRCAKGKDKDEIERGSSPTLLSSVCK